jgi:hypothetical protein
MNGEGARVERVDHHLAIGGPGDLDATIEQVLRLVRDFPVGRADRGGFGEEVGHAAGIEFLLARRARGEALLAARFEAAA